MTKACRDAFWNYKVDAERSSPRRLWRTIDELMGRGRAPTSCAVGADEIHRFFDEKVIAVRTSTSKSSPPSFTTVQAGCSFGAFRTLTADDVTAAVRALPDKQCMSDPLPINTTPQG